MKNKKRILVVNYIKVLGFYDKMKMVKDMYAEVLVEIMARGIDSTFTYQIPDKLKDEIVVGKRVLVPFSKRKLEGFVMQVHSKKPEYDVKEILEVTDEHPVLNKELLELGTYMHKKTLATLISCYQTMLPAALKAHQGFYVSKKYDLWLVLKDCHYQGTSEKQNEILSFFEKSERILKKEAMKISSSSVKTLLKKGVLEEEKREVYRMQEETEKEEKKVTLNSEQQHALDEVLKSKDVFQPFLLFGVTGSGKTEVYMHIIEEILLDKKEVIVLVPEISLTPQMVDVFKRRFGNKVAILHSRLSNGEKYDEWRKIERKEVSIVIGARSAIFAPFTKIGCIIVDEEQTDTYRQENNPRYHAIDIALKRAEYYHCPVVLGSATPSIESFTRAKLGVYQLLELKERINKTLPQVKLLDMKDIVRTKNNIIGTPLLEKMNEVLKRKEQIILLLNRRGFSTIITCKECGFTHKCPNCDIPLTYHKATNSMRCHYCGYTHYRYVTCPECQSKHINEYGMGTEKLEQIVQELFPQVRTLRMDVDTTRLKGSHERIITKFKHHEADILIGTQMISKGLDFPNVTLVGVLNGDASLNIPDFRSSERTFQLLNQVSGRAGRGEKAGEVYIQGFNIDHYSIVLASRHDYETFYEEEMRLRKKLQYPPFTNLIVLRLKGKDFDVLNEEVHKIATFLHKQVKNTSILGPGAANMPKVNKIYQMQIILKYKHSKDVLKPVVYLNNHYKKHKKVTLEVDINPLHI